MRPEETKDACQVALRRLAVRDRTESEIKGFLREKGFGDEAVTDAVETLRRWGYLNDERVAMATARDRVERSGWGPARVIRELLSRGVDPMVANSVLARVMEGKEEEGLAEAAAKRYAKTHPGVQGEKRLRRLAAYLGRKGYSPEVIGRVIKEYSARDGSEDGA